MANTYNKVYIQAVFAVKYRAAVLDKAWRDNVFAVMGNLINETGCNTIIVNGVEDHVHCFFSMKPSISISELMKIVKAKSSKYINENDFLKHRFEWQRGFGSFSYNQSQVDMIYNYIKNQEKHHAKTPFKKEYKAVLDEFEIPYEDQYLFEELI
jgi:REP element-mobilizing transposase RayT